MQKQTKNKPFFSIVIPTLNEEKYLPRLLNDLAAQTYKNFEVIHVDANSEDNTVKEAQKFKNKINLTSHVTQKRNISFQRNLGAQLSKTKWVIFMDADDKFPPHFLQGIKYNLDKYSEIDIFTCWIEPSYYDLKDYPIVQVINLSLEFYARVKPSTPGSLIGVRKKITETIHFKEDQMFNEDAAFSQEVSANGYNYTVFKDPRYFYSFRRIKKEGLLKMFRKAALAQIQVLSGKYTSGEHKDYPMLGGKYYENEEIKQRFPFMKDAYSVLSNASKKQIKKAKNILEQIKNIEI